MLEFILRRSCYSLLIILGVLILTFLLFNVGAGDPAAAMLGKNASAAEIDALRRRLGCDLPLFYGHYCLSGAFQETPAGSGVFRRQYGSEPVWAETPDGLREVRGNEFRGPSGTTFYRCQRNGFNSQFFRALGELVSFRKTFPYVTFFDFGDSLVTHEPVREILWRGMKVSLLLMLPVFFGEMLFGIAFALLAAAFRNRWPDRLILLLSVAGMSVSYVVVIILGQWFLGYRFGLFPLWGFESPANLLLPVTVGIISGIGANVRFYRTVFVDELGKEYLRTAAAKGVSPFKLYGVHLLRNAALQIMTRAGSTLPFIFTGSLLLESFFGIPGLGYAGIEALYNSDIALLKALVVLSALLFVVINLLCDLAYAWADPRVRVK
ncbi:MAG: ABC transporter permease [Lentisphaeria bacterium]|nr:ABC transporter permease [Lentisphaeria bacterium]